MKLITHRQILCPNHHESTYNKLGGMYCLAECWAYDVHKVQRSCIMNHISALCRFSLRLEGTIFFIPPIYTRQLIICSFTTGIMSYYSCYCRYRQIHNAFLDVMIPELRWWQMSCGACTRIGWFKHGFLYIQEQMLHCDSLIKGESE